MTVRCKLFFPVVDYVQTGLYTVYISPLTQSSLSLTSRSPHSWSVLTSLITARTSHQTLDLFLKFHNVSTDQVQKNINNLCTF